MQFIIGFEDYKNVFLACYKIFITLLYILFMKYVKFYCKTKHESIVMLLFNLVC